MKTINKIIFILLFFVFVVACETPKPVSDIPEIMFKSLSIANDTDLLGNDIKKVKLTFSLIDGDGDIGLPEGGYPGFDTLNNKNLFVTIFQKKDGEYLKLPWMNDYTTPYQAPEGQDKTLKADYEITMEPQIQFIDFDTLKFEFYIYDRKLHRSNLGQSPDFPTDTLGTIE